MLSIVKAKSVATRASEYSFSSWAFQRVLGLCYAAAFGSLAAQITGLIGRRGILPAEHLVGVIENSNLQLQVLGVFNLTGISDGSLQLICWLGALAGGLAAIGFATPLMFLFCWFSWLSMVHIGQDFLSFQWDILLLEAGFLSIFLAPWRVLDWPIGKHKTSLGAPPIVSVWLFQWLLFRLMFESGLCKIASGDETWRSFTAMNYHYHTQPLPTPLAWLCDKSPELLLKSITFSTLAIELIVPFLVPIARLRIVAAFLLMFLQICIALTGNYAYFNLLTFAVCFFLIRNSDWIRFYALFTKKIPARFRNQSPVLAHKLMALMVASLIFGISVLEIGKIILPLPDVIQECLDLSSRYYLVNSYGLFATMTTVRDEIVLEGSSDGLTWKEYQFRYKPGSLDVPPCIVAPFQPRLDWQMWFAALGDISYSPWFAHFIIRVFEGSPAVLHLLKSNPFPDRPPEYLRARLYTYTFAGFDDLIHTGNWWRREYKGVFLPVISRAVLVRSRELD